MIPARYVRVDRLPVTVNGKVDRAALREIRAAGGDRGTARAAAKTGLEARIAGAWREVLGLDDVGRDENFFDVGGHSLLVPRLQSRLRQALAEELSARAAFVDGRRHERAAGDAPRPGARRAALADQRRRRAGRVSVI
jgi:hypothetical protein